MAAPTTLKRICSHTKLERDKGLLDLKLQLTKENEESMREKASEFRAILCDEGSTWEALHGSLQAVKMIVIQKKVEQGFFGVDIGLKLLEHGESRVRLAAGELLGAQCSIYGSATFEACREPIFLGIRSNLDRDKLGASDEKAREETQKLAEKISELSDKPASESKILAENVFHDTAGWRSLETWMKCLQFVVEGCSGFTEAFVDESLKNLIVETLCHKNRFVREAGFETLASVLLSVKSDSLVFDEEIALNIAAGLADNWSQVRLAASSCCRNFLQSVGDKALKFHHILLPPLCLNRYYVADGVRLHSQETWKLCIGTGGANLVTQHLQAVVEFYISQTEADNHAVREAACACIAELVSKLPAASVQPFVGQLLAALLVCFHDESWPVRDAACVACGNFILCFPADCESMLTQLYELFFLNLGDNIPSVREGAAIALSNVVRAYGDAAKQKVLEKIQQDFNAVEKQKDATEKYQGLDKGVATYGVVKRIHDNDAALHTDQQTYSCGSLGPKMKRGGGCMDHKFKRDAQPWEAADGSMYLFGELSQVAQDEIVELFPAFVAAVSHRHYLQHVNLLETFCKQLPKIADNVGKKRFKQHIETFFDHVFYSLECDNALTSAAANQCLTQMARNIGPNILRGRVEAHNPRFLPLLNQTLSAAPL